MQIRRLDYRAVIELVGVTAVVSSLIFVGLQLSQDRNIALVDSRTAENESRKADRRASLESETFMALQEILWARGDRPSWWNDSLENSRIGSLASGAHIMAAILDEELDLLGIDAQFFRYQHGLLADDEWSRVRVSLKNRLLDPFRRAVALNLDIGLRELILTIIDELERESGT